MNEIRLKFGKFFIILGGISILLFAFSIIAESVNSYLIITGILMILFGTILRKKKKQPDIEISEPVLKPNRWGKNHNSSSNVINKKEDRQSRRSQRS